MARVLNAGFAARNGLAAALLAAEGFEGPARPLEGLRGFSTCSAAAKICAGSPTGWASTGS